MTRNIALIKQFSSSVQKNDLKLSNILLLKKLSRLDNERLRNPDLSETQLKESILRRGIDYKAMVKHHDLNVRFQEYALNEFEKFKICTKVCDRFSYTEAAINSSDVVITVGGDGTFLLAANKIRDNTKPIMGLNSDPCRSEGHLCLPKEFSSNLTAAVQKLASGDFRWMFRSRIRVTVTGGNVHDEHVELHHPATPTQAEKHGQLASDHTESLKQRILPVLALNEVFLGENLAAKVSYFEMKINGCSAPTRVKSSGVLVCTGTGSTSWNLSSNRLNEEDVKQLIQVYSGQTDCQFHPAVIPSVCRHFNDRFIFSPEETKLGYTIRDLIFAGVWPKPKGLLPARGFVQRMEIKSRCSDAGLVIDGGVVFPFNDGTTAVLETAPEAALKTIIM